MRNIGGIPELEILKKYAGQYSGRLSIRNDYVNSPRDGNVYSMHYSGKRARVFFHIYIRKAQGEIVLSGHDSRSRVHYRIGLDDPDGVDLIQRIISRIIIIDLNQVHQLQSKKLPGI